MNNHRSEPEPAGDIQGYEGDVPGENTNRGMNRTTPQLSAGETCQTLTATGYGFTRDVHHLRPVSELAQMLVRSAAAGANFLLNAEPTPEGVAAAPAVDRLTRIGSWLRGSGEGIYGTRAGVLHVADQFGDERHCGGVASTKGREPGRHDVHLLDGSVPASFFADLPESAHADTAAAMLLHDGGPVPAEIRGDGGMLRITVPAERRDSLITTIRLDSCMTSPKAASVVVPLVPLDGVDDVGLVRGDVDLDADPAMSRDDQIRHGILLFEALVDMASGRRASPRYSASAPRRSCRCGWGP
jgi:alpha-L-fucosidase